MKIDITGILLRHLHKGIGWNTGETGWNFEVKLGMGFCSYGCMCVCMCVCVCVRVEEGESYLSLSTPFLVGLYRAGTSGRASRALALPLFCPEHFTRGHACTFVGSFPGFINSKACMGMRLSRLYLHLVPQWGKTTWLAATPASLNSSRER